MPKFIKAHIQKAKSRSFRLALEFGENQADVCSAKSKTVAESSVDCVSSRISQLQQAGDRGVTVASVCNRRANVT
jgi:hypothetical protein